MNLFNLGNKKYEIPKSSKPLYRKIDKEKRPETLKTEDILTAENEI
jgi:aspartyl/asparaginyl-tRNA synthetase